jgi:hypothetical protein
MAAIPVTSGLQLLLDARTITGLADADSVSAWADQSGQGNNAAQGTALDQPTYRTNVFGSNPAVRFGAERQHLFGAFSAWGTHTGQTVLFCANNVPSSQIANGRFLATSTNAGSDFQNHLIYPNGANGDLYVFSNGTNIKATTVPQVLSSGITSPVVFGMGVDGTTLSYVCNGVLGKSTHTAGLPAAPTKYSFGYLNAGSPSTSFGALWDCHFAAFYNGKLTDTQINQVACWMLQEIGALPASGGTSGFTGLSGVGRLGT